MCPKAEGSIYKKNLFPTNLMKHICCLAVIYKQDDGTLCCDTEPEYLKSKFAEPTERPAEAAVVILEELSVDQPLHCLVKLH